MHCSETGGLSDLRIEQNANKEIFINQKKVKVMASHPDGLKTVVHSAPSDGQVYVFRIDFSAVNYRIEAFNFSDKAYTLKPLYSHKCKRLD
jgi:hypothetical protein